ncbi:oncomodulin-like isoform X1 [Gigantopelta aegis]|uniref:oncomodulin-like isoform X1 n=1 Tax=Gigantopelta aegis TaxID=1735272 RepID=UPI001B88AC41|nr:oncomodulin-like isoform X1 [Gigantopelta aegis]
MKYVLLLLVMVAITVDYQAEAWRGRRFWRRAKRIYRYYRTYKLIAGVVGRKRDLFEFDKNEDGFLDQSELEDVLNTREARDVLEMADEDGNSKVSMEEFQKMLTEMSKLE